MAECCAQAGEALLQRGSGEAALKWLAQAVDRYVALKEHRKCVELLLREPKLRQVRLGAGQLASCEKGCWLREPAGTDLPVR